MSRRHRSAPGDDTGTALISSIAGLLVFLAMLLNVTIGSTAGAMTPMILARMRKDPALASSLLLTATTDMVGLFILLGLVSLALRFFQF